MIAETDYPKTKQEFDDRSQRYFSKLAQGDVSIFHSPISSTITVCVDGRSIGEVHGITSALMLFEKVVEICKRHGEGSHPKTDCCGYEAPKSLPYPVMWNKLHQVVQCHKCGRIFSPAASGSQQNPTHSPASGEAPTLSPNHQKTT
jgi:uncharacterized protein YheU (UPF0270 family)